LSHKWLTINDLWRGLRPFERPPLHPQPSLGGILKESVRPPPPDFYNFSVLQGGYVCEGVESTMLVLSRKRDESIVIAGNITITVVDIRGDKVRLGIAAPAEVPVHRREVYDAIKRDEASAPATAPEK
jgi:carbon storage regulator